EVACYVLRSKSGKGYHAYIFFKEAVPAWKARLVLFAILREAGCIGDDAEVSSFDRLFPNQDALSGKGFGNLIALPFQG
ncbi:TOTE conflict system archaeo-eukaryotic primase domain-containing protein, partial [Klebsiella pneumoniae]|uniref:TOTE conflict system archaeo-eukaryotic primase domain-containing protein n=1 Tax=Klebsiella pneumoniae TaxID=573 RepID=UPI003F812105